MSARPLNIMTIPVDENGNPSKVDHDAHMQEVSDRLAELDRLIDALTATDKSNLATVTRAISNVSGGGATPTPVAPRRLAKLAVLANTPNYPIGFVPDASSSILVVMYNQVLTPDDDYTIAGDTLTLDDNRVSDTAEGYILVEAQPL